MALTTTLLFYSQEKTYHLFFDTQLKMSCIFNYNQIFYKKLMIHVLHATNPEQLEQIERDTAVALHLRHRK